MVLHTVVFGFIFKQHSLEWLLKPNCHQMKAGKVIHSWVKYNMPNKSIARSSQGSSFGKRVLLQRPSHHHIQLAAVEQVAIGLRRAFVKQWKKPESFTLGSLSLNNFCNGMKKRTLPAKRRNLPAKRRIFLWEDWCVFCCCSKVFILKLKCLTDQMDTANANNEATQESARI